MLSCLTLVTNAQEIKLSANLVSPTWIRFNNGFKRLATNDRAAMIEYEHELKRYSWSYNAAIGQSRLTWNQRVDSLNSDTYNTAGFLHFRPLGIKKYYRISRVSRYYLELMAGFDYLYSFSQKPENPDLNGTRMKDLGFAVGLSAKGGLKVAVNKKWSVDIGLGGGESIFSNISFNKAQDQRVKFKSAVLFITFYRSVKNEK